MTIAGHSPAVGASWFAPMWAGAIARLASGSDNRTDEGLCWVWDIMRSLARGEDKGPEETRPLPGRNCGLTRWIEGVRNVLVAASCVPCAAAQNSGVWVCDLAGVFLKC